MINQTEPFALSVCRILSGTKNNIIPDYANLEGTFRSLDEGVSEKSKTSLIEMTNSTCKAFGAVCQIEFKKDVYPITHNNPTVTKTALQILSLIAGTTTQQAKPVLGAEDFSRFLQKAVGAFYFPGTKNQDKGCTFPNHSLRFKVDEDIMRYGAISLAKIAVEFSRM
jgi:carboxypeptidase Ss1